MTKIFFRADGNSQIGLGHLYRTLALVNMLKDDFDCCFVTQCTIPAIQEQIARSASLLVLPQADDLEKEAKDFAAQYLSKETIMVLDGYHFTTNYQKNIKKTGAKLVCIDDIYACHFVADVLINHAGGITPHYYKSNFYTQYYLGLDYLLLRQPFLQAAQHPIVAQEAKEYNIFVCMGGADSNNNTLHVLQTIAKKWKANLSVCYVVLGQAYLHREQLEQFIKHTKLDVQLLSNLSAQEMVHYMQLCSIAVCPPSGVAFEYLCTKGSLYLYQIADNQKDVKKYLLEEQLAFDLEKDFPAAPDRVTAALKAQQIYFHGKSGQYLLNKFKRLEQEIYLQPKRASINAMMQYFEWANAPEVRKSAFNSAPIPLENHQAWFYKKIDDPDALLLYFEYKGEPLGQVRLELKEQEWAQISYSIDPNYYGNGFGTQVLKLTLLYALEHNFAQCFYGEVKAYNIASLKVFRKLAFDEVYVEEEEKYVYRINLAAPNNLY